MSTVAKPVSKFFLVLSAIGLLIWSIGVFIGLYFYSTGSWGLSVPIALVVGGAMGFFLFMLCRVTNKCASDRTQKLSHGLAIWLPAYAVVTLFSAAFLLHAVAVTTTVKTDNRDAAIVDLQHLYYLVDDANAPEGSYAEYVNNEIKRLHDANTHLDASTLEVYKGDLRKKLMQSSGYSAIHDEVVVFWQEADYTVRNWDIFFLPYISHTFATKQQQWLSALSACAQKADSVTYKDALYSHTAYKPAPQFTTHLDASFTTLGAADFSLWAYWCPCSFRP